MKLILKLVVVLLLSVLFCLGFADETFNKDSSNVDVCFECCAYGKCPDGWTCCGCPNVCICCDDNYECTSGDPYSCVSPSAGELSFVAYLRKNHLIKSKKALENVQTVTINSITTIESIGILRDDKNRRTVESDWLLRANHPAL